MANRKGAKIFTVRDVLHILGGNNKEMVPEFHIEQVRRVILGMGWKVTKTAVSEDHVIRLEITHSPS